MAYQSLYRRYRPRRFSDVRGQEHAVRALRNAVRDEKVTHAYLFSGPRGTGKTSTARILAKALNCEHLQDGEPCGTCDSCLAIDAGTSYDVQELDAASNNGVADMKDLISRANLGSPGRTKVYILDEVHMLTAAASAALLKTLEEPPAHVVFVLATTDHQKVLPTIRSRTQHYDFHLLSVEELSEHVAWVIHDAGLGLPDDVIEHVVRAGAGSARDTLSALDQVAAAGGVFDRQEALADLLDAVAQGDAGKALAAVAEAVSAGRDPRILGEALLGRLRDVFLVRMGGPTPHLPPGDIDIVRSWADQLGDRATTRALEAVGDALLEMRQAPDPRIPLEVALVKMTRVEGGTSVDALVDRIARLEAALASGNVPVEGPAASSAPAVAGPPPARSAASTAGSAPPSAPARPAAPARTAPATPRGSDRPAPPPRPGGGPADQARAKLAEAKAERAATTGRPATPAKPAAAAPASSPPAAEPAGEPTPS
ncbi:MAG: DNA polymerase III subunit gamma/tau, partial [Aquihabitans sp.]